MPGAYEVAVDQAPYNTVQVVLDGDMVFYVYVPIHKDHAYLEEIISGIVGCLPHFLDMKDEKGSPFIYDCTKKYQIAKL